MTKGHQSARSQGRRDCPQSAHGSSELRQAGGGARHPPVGTRPRGQQKHCWSRGAPRMGRGSGWAPGMRRTPAGRDSGGGMEATVWNVLERPEGNLWAREGTQRLPPLPLPSVLLLSCGTHKRGSDRSRGCWGPGRARWLEAGARGSLCGLGPGSTTSSRLHLRDSVSSVQHVPGAGVGEGSQCPAVSGGSGQNCCPEPRASPARAHLPPRAPSRWARGNV